MSRLKVLVVAAAVLLSAGGAMANNFGTSDQIYIPIAAKAAGGSGTFFSDIWVTNMEATTPVTVSVIFTPIGQADSSQCPGFNAPNAPTPGCPKNYPNLFTLQGGERREFINFIETALTLPNGGQGSLIFNACESGRDCIATQDEFGVSPFYKNIAVFSRIYSIPPGTALTDNPAPRTVGQTFPGTPWFMFASQNSFQKGFDRVTLSGVRNTGTGANPAGTYRSNIGFLNTSQFSRTTIVVKLFNGNLKTQIGSTFTRELGPLQSLQPSIISMFPEFAAVPSSTNAYVTVEQTGSVATAIPGDTIPAGCATNGGCPGFIAFGSVLDNLSGDATTLQSTFEKSLSEAALGEIFGKDGTGKPTTRRATRR